MNYLLVELTKKFLIFFFTAITNFFSDALIIYYDLLNLYIELLIHLQDNIYNFISSLPKGSIFLQKFYTSYYWFFINIYIDPLTTLDKNSTVGFQFTKDYFLFLFQVFFLVIIAIWARAAGPRFRLDQILNMTWKDIFIYLSLFLFFLMFIIILI